MPRQRFLVGYREDVRTAAALSAAASRRFYGRGVKTADSEDWLPAKSVVLAVKEPPPALIARDQVPLAAETVPRDWPFSNSSTVVPASAVPTSVKGLMMPVMTGGAGGRESTWITRSAELGEVPARLRALAVNRYAPSAGTVTIRLHVPAIEAVVVPNEAAPSKTSTVAPACAVPDSVSVRLRLQL